MLFKVFSSILNHLMSVLLQHLIRILSPALNDDANRTVLFFSHTLDRLLMHEQYAALTLPKN